MTLTIPDEVRAKAEIYHGDAAGQEKTRLMLQETGLPSGLLPLQDIIECGYVEETGFVWLKQRRKVDHYFAKAGRHVSYAAEVSAVAEEGRLKKITGVKAKEILIWVALNEIFVDNPPQGKLHVKTVGGFSRTFPVEAFEAADAGRVFHRYGGVGGAVAAAEWEKKKEEARAAGEKRKPAADAAKEAGSKDDKDGAANGADVDKVEEKLKDMSTADQAAVQAEGVTAKN